VDAAGSVTPILVNRADNRADSSNSIGNKAVEGGSKTCPLHRDKSKTSVNADEMMVRVLVRNNRRRRTEADPARAEIKVRDTLDRNIEIIGGSTSEIIL
jgi:hypothetical protein